MSFVFGQPRGNVQAKDEEIEIVDNLTRLLTQYASTMKAGGSIDDRFAVVQDAKVELMRLESILEEKAKTGTKPTIMPAKAATQPSSGLFDMSALAQVLSPPNLPAMGPSSTIHATSDTPKFKVILVGDGGVAVWIQTLRSFSSGLSDDERVKAKASADEMMGKYLATIGVEVHSCEFEIQESEQRITFQVWDTAGQEKFSGLRDGYYIAGNAAVIMFDVSSRISYKNVPNWHRDVVRVCESIPIVLVGNKVDIPNPTVKPKMIQFHRKKNMQFYHLSTASLYNLARPLEYLASKLMGQSSVSFKGMPLPSEGPNPDFNGAPAADVFPEDEDE